MLQNKEFINLSFYLIKEIENVPKLLLPHIQVCTILNIEKST